MLNNWYRTVVRRCSVKKVFFKNSQISQENICARVSLCQASGLQLYQKDTLGHCSCEFCKIFKNICFYRTPPVAASAGNKRLDRNWCKNFFVKIIQ